MSEWESIETAPRKGERVLIYSKPDIYIAIWKKLYSNSYNTKYVWMIHEDGNPYSEFYLECREVTHWIPLPEKPQVTLKQESDCNPELLTKTED